MVIRKIKKIAITAQKKYAELLAPTEEPKAVAPKKKSTKKKIEKRVVRIYPSDIAKGVAITILMLLISYLIFEVRDILMIFFVSILFAAALDPTIDKLERYKIPRNISTILIFVLLIGVFSLFIGTFVPVVANQIMDLGLKAQVFAGNIIKGDIQMPFYLEWVNPILQELFIGTDANTLTLNLQNYLIQFGEELRSLAGNAFVALKAITNGLTNGILVLLLTYFMIVDEQVIDNFILKIFPSRYENYITQKNKSIKTKVGEWLRGQIALGVVIGIITYIGLVIIGVEYAFTLALFAGLTELIPVIGPLIAWIAAIPIAANASMNTLIWVTILYFTIQRLENNILVPIIMKQATGLHPIIVLLAMLIGYEFYGILGIIISVPVSAVAGIFLSDYLSKDK